MTEPTPTGDGLPRAVSVRQLILFAVSCFVIFGYLATSLFYTLPSNALSSRHSKGLRAALNILTPENWAFFTRNPESVQNGIYAYGTDRTIRNLLRTPQGEPSNLFGLSRTQRAQGPELGYINAAAAHTWSPCSGYLTDCLSEASRKPSLMVNNTSPLPTICGDAYITQEQTVPWSFRNQVSYTRRVVQVAHLDVRCK
ncbi:SdpA family antimicrobial peptide system protein [Streptomyces sp. NPDC054933]